MKVTFHFDFFSMILILLRSFLEKNIFFPLFFNVDLSIFVWGRNLLGSTLANEEAYQRNMYLFTASELMKYIQSYCIFKNCFSFENPTSGLQLPHFGAVMGCCGIDLLYVAINEVTQEKTWLLLNIFIKLRISAISI